MFLSVDHDILSDDKLLALSKHFTIALDLRDVAFRGLGIPSTTVEMHIQNNQGRIGEATYSLFHAWRSTQPNLKTASANMIQALENADKALYKQALEDD